MSYLMESDLTEEMNAKVPEYYKKWIDYHRCTIPIDSNKCIEAVTQCYKDADQTPPLKFVLASSNLAMYLIYRYYEELFQTDCGDMECNPFEDFRGIPIKSLLNILTVYEIYKKDLPNIKIKADGNGSFLISPDFDYSAKINESPEFLSTKRDIINNLAQYEKNTHFGYHQAHSAFILDFIKNEVIPSIAETKPERVKELTEYYKLDKIDGFLEVVKSCGWMLFTNQVAFISDRYCELHLEDAPENEIEQPVNRRTHNLNGPAIRFSDGLKLYNVKGMRVPAYIIEEPEKITVDKIMAEDNAEIRRVMVDKMGHEKFIESSGAKLIDKSQYGELYKAEFEGDEPLCILKVYNSTPEPDGSIKIYYLQVPASEEFDPKVLPNGFPADNPLIGDMLTAKQAAAWLVDETEDSYNPEIET